MKKLLCAVLVFVGRLACAALSVSNAPVTGITSSNATLSAVLVSTNVELAQLTFHWGTSDGGTNATAWSESAVESNAVPGPYTHSIGSLAPSTMYFFRAAAADSSNTVWSSRSGFFWTAPVAPTNLPASAYRPVMVDTNGDLAAPSNLWTRAGVALSAGRTATTNYSVATSNLAWSGSALVCSNAGTAWFTLDDGGAIAGFDWAQNGVVTYVPTVAYWTSNGYVTVTNRDFVYPLASTVRVSVASGVPGMPSNSTPLVLSNIVVSAWTKPANVGRTADFGGVVVRVDNPVGLRDAVNLQYLESFVGSGVGGVATSAPTAWSRYPAVAVVDCAGNALEFDANYRYSTSGDVLRLTFAGSEVMRVQGGGAPSPEIRTWSIAGTNATIVVSGVSGWQPIPQWTDNLVTGVWSVVGSYTSTYPELSAGTYTLAFPLVTNASAYYRVIATNAGGAELSIDFPVPVSVGGVDVSLSGHSHVITNLSAGQTNTLLVLRPNGVGGVEWFPSATYWGLIGGSITNQGDLIAALGGKQPTGDYVQASAYAPALGLAISTNANANTNALVVSGAASNVLNGTYTGSPALYQFGVYAVMELDGVWYMYGPGGTYYTNASASVTGLWQVAEIGAEPVPTVTYGTLIVTNSAESIARIALELQTHTHSITQTVEAVATNVFLNDLNDLMTLNSIPVGNGSNLVLRTPAEVRTNLSLVPGVDVPTLTQMVESNSLYLLKTDAITNVSLADLTDIMPYGFIPVGAGSNLVLRTPAEVRTNLNLVPGLDIPSTGHVHEVEGLTTSETNTMLVLSVDGGGGVRWVTNSVTVTNVYPLQAVLDSNAEATNSWIRLHDGSRLFVGTGEYALSNAIIQARSGAGAFYGEGGSEVIRGVAATTHGVRGDAVAVGVGAYAQNTALYADADQEEAAELSANNRTLSLIARGTNAYAADIRGRVEIRPNTPTGYGDYGLDTAPQVPLFAVYQSGQWPAAKFETDHDYAIAASADQVAIGVSANDVAIDANADTQTIRVQSQPGEDAIWAMYGLISSAEGIIAGGNSDTAPWPAPNRPALVAYRDGLYGVYAVALTYAVYAQAQTRAAELIASNETCYVRSWGSGSVSNYALQVDCLYGNAIVATSSNTTGLLVRGVPYAIEAEGAVSASGGFFSNGVSVSYEGHTHEGMGGGKSVTNSWVAVGDVTNTQIFINGLLTSWSTNGVEL